MLNPNEALVQPMAGLAIPDLFAASYKLFGFYGVL